MFIYHTYLALLSEDEIFYPSETVSNYQQVFLVVMDPVQAYSS
jgi:hypothetical protein